VNDTVGTSNTATLPASEPGAGGRLGSTTVIVPLTPFAGVRPEYGMYDAVLTFPADGPPRTSSDHFSVVQRSSGTGSKRSRPTPARSRRSRNWSTNRS
jgi:hypothetical protein